MLSGWQQVIVTTIQKLGLALDGTYKKNYKERLEPLSKKRVVFIFDECHRSQFGDNHKAIKEFFPNAQLFGFTGTPIFDENATYKIREDEYGAYKTTEDIFHKRLHAYTITHAIEDRNVLKFHIDYFKGKGTQNAKPGEAIAQQAVVEAILDKHNAATNSRRFNATLATASINNAIEYYQLFKTIQKRKQEENEDYVSLNVACVFSPPSSPSLPSPSLPSPTSNIPHPTSPIPHPTSPTPPSLSFPLPHLKYCCILHSKHTCLPGRRLRLWYRPSPG